MDSHVGEHLFSHAIKGDLAAGTTRLLVTHHVHFLPRCDKVIMLKEGKVVDFDEYKALVKRGVDFAGAVKFAGEKKGKERSDSIASEGR